MEQYVISYRQTENGVQYYATPLSNPGENHLVGFVFGSPQDAEAVAMSLNQQQSTPESAYNLVPGIAQERKAPILTQGTGEPQQEPGTKPVQPGANSGQVSWETEEERAARIAADPSYTPRVVRGAGSTGPVMDPRSPDGSPTYVAPVRQDLTDPTITGVRKELRKKVYADAAFGDTTGRTRSDGSMTPTNLGRGGITGTGAPVGTSPTDWGLFEQDLIAGSVDPRRAVSEQLSRQGLPTHANRGFLEDVYSNYGSLRQMQNPGLTPEPVELFNEQSQFANDLMGMDGNSMRRVDTRGLWDNQFSQDYIDTTGAEYNAVAANGGGAGEQHEYEFNDINNNIAALSPFIGEQNAGYLMTLTQQAYDEYINSPARNQMTFAVYLRDVKGAGEWY